MLEFLEVGICNSLAWFVGVTDRQEAFMEKRIYKTAMYLRLSKGDGDVDGNIKSESNSITTRG